jgi:hypothetical protein
MSWRILKAYLSVVINMKNNNFDRFMPLTLSLSLLLAAGASAQSKDGALVFSSSPTSSEFYTAYGLAQRDGDSLESLSDFDALLAEMETAYGPYDYRLAETLQSAGDLLDSRGEYAAAAQLYERSLHITRINNGLVSEAQLAIVEKLINCGSAMADWALVDENYQYLHFLYTRLYKDNIPQLRRGLAQVADWHVLAINNDLAGDKLTHLRHAHKVYQQRLDLAQQENPQDQKQSDSLRETLNIIRYHIDRITGTDMLSIHKSLQSPRSIAAMDY